MEVHESKTRIIITNKNDNKNPYKPLIYSLLIAIGILAGMAISRISLDKIASRPDKIDEIVSFIKYKYVDTVNIDKLTETAIDGMLSALDPHSVYIPVSEMKAVNEDLDGNFEGIGIEFFIVKDTITVVTVIPNGPAESSGLQAGDRIVKINDTIVAGTKIKNQDVMRKLKGKGGTKVTVSIARGAKQELKNYTITRGKIPLYSVDASYLLNNKTGYIKISRFSSQTASEFKKHLRELTDKNIESLVIDLRQNPGGYLQAATQIADELLGGEKLIVYTQGNTSDKVEYYSGKPGLFERGKLAILIDQNSASASEILAGAVQDWDRGTVIGRTSFGKGLVQEQYELEDGSALRLTIARYYTPSGRFIQRPYEHGAGKYNDDIYERYARGEFVHEDTTRTDSLKYETAAGRIVYGGGGIRPDIFVPLDTAGDWEYFFQTRILIPEYIYHTYSNNPNMLNDYKDMYDFDKHFSVSPLSGSFKKYIQDKGVKYDETKYAFFETRLNTLLKAYLAKQKWQSAAFYLIENAQDDVVQTALKEIEKRK